MNTEILLGNEAVALGAVHAGLTSGFSYPGTPATEVMEYLINASAKEAKFNANWCVNEKVAYEEALGVSYSGKRTMVSMKHVGLNVAADPFMNSALTKINGGLVVVVADDPGMHSSQNEQDSRYYANFANIICLEPSDQQEAYDITRAAFDVSEKFNIPVLIRVVTRLSHSRSKVQTKPPRCENKMKYGEGRDWTLLPANARKRFEILMERQAEIIKFSNESDFNKLYLNEKTRSFGIIVSGIAYNYVQENLKGLPQKPSLLKVCTYPLPEELISRLVQHVDNILVVEEGYPFIEKSLRGLFGISGKTVNGKLSGHLPITGELSSDNVRKALEMIPNTTQILQDFTLPARPPQLCQGCPHGDTLNALNKVLEPFSGAIVFSDIGCYTLGALPPYNAVDTCVCMGASIGMAKGGAETGVFPSVAVIGDSTFSHSGMTPLLDAAANDTNMTVIIMDNNVVAMTGGQPTFASGEELIRIVEGLGVRKDHIQFIVPLPKNLEKNIQIIKREIDHKGLSVIIAHRECIQETKKKKKRGAR